MDTVNGEVPPDPVDPECTDSVTVTAEGEWFTCHRSKLSTASGYFMAMFGSEMIESRAQEICLKQVDHKMLKILITYSENDQENLSVNEENAIRLLQCACMLQFESAILNIETFLLTNMTCQNCLNVLIVSDQAALNNLFNKAKAHALWYFDDIVQTGNICDLPFTLFRGLIDSEIMRTNSELNIFRAIEQWYADNKGEEEDHLSDMLTCVRWEVLSESELNQILNNPLMSQDEQHQVYRQRSQTSETDNNVKKVTMRSPQQVLAVVGGHWIGGEKDVHIPHVLMYTGTDSTLHTLSSLPDDYSNIWGHQACVIGKDMYILGGEKIGSGMRKDWYNKVWRYDSLSDTWSLVSEMPTPRRHHTAVVADQSIYVIGGISRHRIKQDTVEVYDTATDAWSNQPPLKQAVYSTAACNCQGNIYVFHDLIEILTPGASSWQQKCGIIPRGMAINWCLADGSLIYMMGVYAYSLYVLDSLTDQLTELGAFQQCYISKACQISNKIYVVGGEDSHLIESYDKKTREFSEECKFDFEIRNHYVVSLPHYAAFR